MKFTDLFVQRPVLATVISLVILVLGLKAFEDLQIRQYPVMETGIITIATTYPGASPTNVQGYVTQPIQQMVAQTEGVDYMLSESTMGMSTITLYLKLDYSTDKALTEVLSLVQQVKYRLPQGVQDSSILKSSSQSPVVYISFASEGLEAQQISDFVSRVAQPIFSTVNGVNNIQLLGQKDFAMRIWLDPLKMAGNGISAEDVENAIKKNNAVSAAGRLKNNLIEININAHTDLQDISQFENIVVRQNKGKFIKISDVATVELGSDNYDDMVFSNGKKNITVAISNTSDSNPLDVIKGIYGVMDDVIGSLPPTMTATVIYDSTEYITASIDDVLHTFVEALVIVIIVVFMFLGAFRAILIPIITIPLSIIGTLFLMLSLGFSINLLTLLAMVLAISLVVDDAIVVVENTFRHLEEGAAPFDAAVLSAREIAGPVITMTITLAAVYAPIGFMGGLTGKLFTEFAFTLAGSVIISGIIALTLSPMMCSKMLSKESLETPLVKKIDTVLEALKNKYNKLLSYLLDNRAFVWPVAATILISLVYMFVNTAQELAPQEDQGVVLAMGTGPNYANTDYVYKYSNPIVEVFTKNPETKMTMAVNGYKNNSTFFGLDVLKPWDERDRTAQQLIKDMQIELQTMPGLQLYTFSPPDLPGTPQGLPFQMVIKSPIDSYETMYQYAENLKVAAEKSGKFIFSKNDLKINKPQIEINIDRDKAAQLGVTASAIGDVLKVFLSEGFINYFSLNGRSYQVISEVKQLDRLDRKALENYYVKSVSGAMVPMSSIVSVKQTIQPSAVNQFQQLNSAMIEGKMMPGVSIGEAYAFMQAKAKEILPASYTIDSSGQLRQFLQEGQSLLVTFALAFIIIFLVLAAQFESFRDPCVILTTVPLSIFGAMLPLYFGVATLNIYTEVGLVTLVGLISKHGILIVDFANGLQRQGMDRREAILEAASIRLRPVLMTTAAMVVGVLPLVTASGAGAESRFSIGLVISVGMTVGTLFTLFILPMIYSYFAEDHANKVEHALPA
ncbi:Efflux pump membrane transporter BepE [Sinobacterium norvegicum]|uniref:Efflux pump membrane transporter BepE n=1 Tax=Sinobacterium norvegicum TaxID=1641715 RepID=A0ABM9AIR8_9GAMM|nr:efflux RND transporter permease subunit [Sinobacterium norvegicum]CAH0993045.1 Efflux pump membrane transporter BepE [Sinobacterium norvegicum]